MEREDNLSISAGLRYPARVEKWAVGADRRRKYEPFTRYPDVVIVARFGGIRGRGYGKDKREQLLGIRIDVATGDFLKLPFECGQLGCGLIVGIQGFLSLFLRHRVNRVARFVAALAVAWSGSRRS